MIQHSAVEQKKEEERKQKNIEIDFSRPIAPMQKKLTSEANMPDLRETELHEYRGRVWKADSGTCLIQQIGKVESRTF